MRRGASPPFPTLLFISDFRFRIFSAFSPSMSTPSAPVVPFLRNGEFIVPSVESHQPVFNPSTGETIALTPLMTASQVDSVVEGAAKAFESWGKSSFGKRVAVMFKFKELMEANFMELVRLVTKENGKTIEEAKGDVRRGIECVEFACCIPRLAQGEHLPQLADMMDATSSREPLGVCAGIVPFNFPCMVPLWMFPLAIACGNTFVLKPSEKVPLTAVRMGELLKEAGLPDGVFNLVQGGREVVDTLCTHPKISSISFVGSTAVARHVYALGCAHGKRVQSAGGAKNVLLVMPDAEMDSTLRAVIGSSFGCAGQRCMAGSVLMAVGDKADEVRDRVVGAMDALKLDDTSANPEAGMGPVIDQHSQHRITELIGAGAQTSAKLVRDGRNHGQPRGFFVGPTLFDHVDAGAKIFREELFGPVLTMLRPKTLDEAIQTMGTISYGNGATIFTSDGGSARQFVREMPAGMLGINVGVPAAPALYSFSGWNNSFFGDLHVMGTEGVLFYTRQKLVLSRWDNTYRRTMGW